MSEIKPALTPEEWKKGVTIIRPGKRTQQLGEWGGPMGFEFFVNSAPEECILWAFDDSWAVALTGERRAAIAAACLHGQPFGFTRDDVRRLRMVLDEADLTDLGPVYAGYMSDERSADVASLYDLADRIEALLPPAETET